MGSPQTIHFRKEALLRQQRVGARAVVGCALSDFASRVENRRSDGSRLLLAWAFASPASIRFGLALFPVPAHRPDRQISRIRPRKRRTPSAGVTRLSPYYQLFRHPTRPGLSLASCQVIYPRSPLGASRVASGLLCVHSIAITPAGLMSLFARLSPLTAAFPG
jgi:hypothetical protein